ncbi:MAG: metal ABC transporter solute-binding protein, Zn/Mn family [Desulfonatronovibrio sp.]
MTGILSAGQDTKKALLILIFMIFFSGVFLWSVNGHARDNTISVLVSIPPQKYFVEKIGGENVNISVLLPPGSSPHAFEPSPSHMMEIGKADAYMAIGVEYEKTLLPRIESMHPDLAIIHTDHGINKMDMTAHDHAPGNEDGHQHGKDPHIWLSPELAMIQGMNIYKALVKLYPGQKDRFQENYINFIKELLDLDQAIKSIFSDSKPGSGFMVFHPSWGYFAREYGLIQIPVETQGKEPRSADLKRLIDIAGQENINTVFVSPQFSQKSAETIAKSIKGKTISIDPLAEDWDQNLLQVAEKISNALRHEHQ